MDLENQKTVGCTQNHGQKIEIRMRFLVFSSSNHNDSSQIRTFVSFYVAAAIFLFFLQVGKNRGLTDDIIWPQKSPPIIFHSFDNKVIAKPTHVP